ncbi:phosphate ABC transporter permease PstA [Thermosediminibacter oceani]|uniref:Phosphate transport system permease protein PstA n=1 Tax=Thermosediminibacter oceani (strain ATCC BAA-1034 / DSM 16646 / JW/IW-1228P) TaxID=555079 RepID=D9S0X3_THEOJ|nr:phosphate ABC transporter permease PstA [Thermosediminibacter oceani]ADL07137.1 phosphate ABC transporter membrane protein 2, PhoT family [Thermosediminibacter oceani DSM 16646]
MTVQDEMFSPGLQNRQRRNRIFMWLFLSANLLGLLVLVVLLAKVLRDSWGWLDLQFITSFPSRSPEKAGILPALYGTIYVMIITAVFAIPLGIAAAVFLEEYSKKSKFLSFIQVNIYNLAGIPSIVYGILGLTVFVRWMMLGRSLLAGGLTMGLLILPVIIVTAQEAIRAVPQSWRHASYALGASKWQTIRYVVLPSALPGILTGIILALSRAIGETAPLIPIGALTFVRVIPRSLFDSFSVLPIQIYNWTSRPQDDFRAIAAAGIVVLLVVLLGMNSAAILLRNKYQGRIKKV